MKTSICSVLYILLISLFTLTTTGCIDAGEPIVIGATMSQSGAYSIQGVPAHNGYKLCESHINEAGGVLGRNIEFLIYDDESDTQKAAELYEKLITEDGVDLVMGPYGSTLTEAVAPVTERHQMVHISPLAATSSIWEQGRRYLFMVLPPAEQFLAGLIDMAEENGLQRVAILQEDQLFPRAAGSGAAGLAMDRGMEVVLMETYRSGTRNFSSFLQTVRDENVEVLGMAASSLSDFVRVVEQMKEIDVNVQMFGTSGSVNEFRDQLGSSADYSYGLSAWEPSLPYPGIDQFTQAYTQKYGIEPSFHAAGAYGSCQLLIGAIRNTTSLEQDVLRDELLSLETTTIFSNYSVDERGYQTANQGLFIQWQHGQKQVVWPEDLATSNAWFPAPRWSDR